MLLNKFSVNNKQDKRDTNTLLKIVDDILYHLVPHNIVRIIVNQARTQTFEIPDAITLKSRRLC